MRIDLLEAYVETYLAQEIRAEALVRRLDSFARFLEVAALANGQVTNVTGIARDAAVARPPSRATSRSWSTRCSALAPAGDRGPRSRSRGTRSSTSSIPAWCALSPSAARAARRRGARAALETWPPRAPGPGRVLRCGGELGLLANAVGREVDFVWSRGARAVGIEVKASRAGVARTAARSRSCTRPGGAIRLFRRLPGWRRRLQDGPVSVLPLDAFARELAAGRRAPRALKG